MQSSFHHTVRTTAFVVGVLFAGAALADAKSTTSNDEAADCAYNASVQLSLDIAQCAVYPTISQLYGNCMADAATKYAIASSTCGTGNASAGLTASGGDDTSGGGKKGRFGPGQFANSVDGLSIGRGDKSTGSTLVPDEVTVTERVSVR